jgi:hypothetical protein
MAAPSPSSISAESATQNQLRKEGEQEAFREKVPHVGTDAEKLKDQTTGLKLDAV